MDDAKDSLDPRIQIELENLNSATDDINKLEIELEEANATFNILSNESTRRLKLLIKKLGNCIEKSRPYYEAVEKARRAQIECQKAAVSFQRSNEIYAAAKETVALAEQRFMSNSHEWQFDNAWQEMLNHATIKVMEAETQKTESGAEHQQKALIFNAAEQKVQQLEEKYRRFIIKSRPYFEENQICQDQLKTQKGRISELQQMIQVAKSRYANALRSLEGISEDIHRQRGDLPVPTGPREPGVGAELSSPAQFSEFSRRTPLLFDHELDDTKEGGLPDELLPPDEQEADEDDDMEDEEDEEDSNEAREDDEDLESLRRKVKVLAIRPVEGGEGKQQEQKTWENELNATVNKLDHLMMMRELGQKCTSSSVPTTPRYTPMRSTSPLPPIKMLRGGGQLPLMNSSLNELSVAKLMPYVMPFSTAVPPTGALNTAVGGGNMGTASAGSFKEQPKRKLSI